MFDIFGTQEPWMAAGKCVGATNPDAWFPVNTEVAEREAPRLCSGCPSQVACARYALDHPELEGIWGGMADRQRSQLRGTPTRPQPTRETCGTLAGASTHKRHREPSCQPCNDAERAYQREGHARRRAAKQAGAA